MLLYFIYLFLLFKESVSNANVHSAYYTHRDVQQHTNMPNIKN